ncbi:50S ribosomal protein L25/general stress protein Ctc [Saccharicrinis sp. FJH54]|uniref:50S ribosomal protein L25/general stress protein Ctc n=1 Tax=Saccharicrinis sp. FJH54 TaxID=3344665 RepID=UPI0035D420F3
MKTFEINGSLRTDLGKKATKALRKEGLVPCVLYNGDDNVHFTVSAQDLHHLLYTDQVYIVALTIDGKVYEAVIKELQFHPVSDEVLHIDFLPVSEDKPIQINIPVKLVGSSEGVKAGGKLQLQMRYLKVKGIKANLPEKLEVDVTALGLGKSIQVGELTFENLELLSAKNAVVVTVKLTRAARGAAAASAEK